MINIDLRQIKSRLNKVRCLKCDKFPDVSIIGNELDIKFCCDDFKRKLVEIAKEEAGNKAASDIRQEIKRIFNQY